MIVRTEESGNNFTLLRLLLALAVVLGHFKLLSGTPYPPFPFNLADAAVDSFFVVSGFLITLSYERTHGLWAFYIRRVFRLYPMYLCIVLIQAVLMMCLLPHGPFSAPHSTLRYLATNAVMANFLQYDIGGVLKGLHNPGINPSLWTLKIEIGFYLIVPLIIVATRRWGWGVLALIFVASVAYDVAMLHYHEIRLARQLPGQMQFFVLGMALCLYGQRLRVHWSVSALLAAIMLTAWTFLHPIPPGICPVLVAAFVFSFALCTPVIRMQRDISYSVYLVHGPLIQTLILLGLFRDTPVFLIGVVATVIVLALATERLVERPGTEFGRRLSRLVRRQRAPAAVGVA
ncbi:MAG TPA: acyltransferase [Acetobacteraceae bacterium]|jgi:peptidoglycan/LPS O-acetylase OafA/YrhL